MFGSIKSILFLISLYVICGFLFPEIEENVFQLLVNTQFSDNVTKIADCFVVFIQSAVI